MEGKELVTENCVRALAAGSELVLGPERIATPAALDLAFQKRISAPGGSDLWTRMKAREGTYVVVVRGGKALVTRVGAGVVETLGEE